ncbi:MAG: FAD-dependent oxidoreductase [Deltaproteobacteria bacterium]|nr:FAD-dependent oxidoreductase [Deltaproteobacteria bacterium]
MGVKLLIIGGVAGGATAAARARRLDENAEIILFERGEYISFANCGLPYYIGKVIKERDTLLVTTAEAFKARYNIDIRLFSEVIEINRSKKQVTVKDIKTGNTHIEKYDKIILSPGAEPLRPPLEGIDLENIYSLRSIPDSDLIKAHVDENKPESTVIVGGGFIGLEMAENLVLRGVKVTIIEMLDQVMAPIDYEMASLVHAHLKEKGVTLILGDGVKSFSKSGNQIKVTTGKGFETECEMVILSIGVRSESILARQAGLTIGKRGGIIVDSGMRTSDPDIFAVGDAVETRDFVLGFPAMTALAGPANKEARIAADNAMGRNTVFKGTMGSAVAKIFDLTVASTGSNEKSLKQNNIPYLISYTHSGSHASYYPDPEMMSIKLVFSPGSGRILGAQIVGGKGVDKRIDVIATAIRGSMTVYDLEELELAYAPPFSSAKDPVNIAGFVAANILKGDLQTVNWNAIKDIDPENETLIDLRDKNELDESGIIKGALHIPLNELRGRLNELDRSKSYIPFCAIGLRGYLGHRILIQTGFKSRNLSGGYKTWKITAN